MEPIEDRISITLEEAMSIIATQDAIIEYFAVVITTAAQMLTGTCKHDFDTSRSARGCDLCAAEIEEAARCLVEEQDAPTIKFKNGSELKFFGGDDNLESNFGGSQA